jgi:hypothetical protein
VREEALGEDGRQRDKRGRHPLYRELDCRQRGVGSQEDDAPPALA